MGSSQYSSQQNVHSPQQSFSSQSSGGYAPQSPYTSQPNNPSQSPNMVPVEPPPEIATPQVINVTLNKKGGGMGLSIVAARVSCISLHLSI